MSIPEPPIVGTSPEFQNVLRTARMVAALDVTVLLTGETGTGKELLAQAMHAASRRADKPFLALNCAALPEHLVESELFGCRRGAFTGAVADQPGKIVSADGGTLLLDEVGELPLAAQAKLLRFLECGEVHPVGQAFPRKVQVRILAATNRDLLREVEAGRFREDLFYRLNVVPIELPPLRERRGDIPVLIEHFMGEFGRAHGLPAASFTRDAFARLKAYRWPGNIRELRNLCERVAILFAGRTVGADVLPREMQNEGERSFSATVTEALALPEGGIVLDDLERTLIGQALVKTGGNRSKAARLLGLTRDTLLYRMKKYEL